MCILSTIYSVHVYTVNSTQCTCVYCQQYTVHVYTVNSTQCTCVYCQFTQCTCVYCQQYTQCTCVYCQQYTVYMCILSTIHSVHVCILSTIHSVHVYTVNNIQKPWWWPVIEVGRWLIFTCIELMALHVLREVPGSLSPGNTTKHLSSKTMKTVSLVPRLSVSTVCPPRAWVQG